LGRWRWQCSWWRCKCCWKRCLRSRKRHGKWCYEYIKRLGRQRKRVNAALKRSYPSNTKCTRQVWQRNQRCFRCEWSTGDNWVKSTGSIGDEGPVEPSFTCKQKASKYTKEGHCARSSRAEFKMRHPIPSLFIVVLSFQGAWAMAIAADREIKAAGGCHSLVDR
jgi:hypothetical protein